MVVGFSFDSNKYFNDSEPWSYKNSNLERMNTIIYTISEQIKNLSILLSPIIPSSTNKVLSSMNISDKDLKIDSILKNSILNHTKELKDFDILFRKIENDN